MTEARELSNHGSTLLDDLVAEIEAKYVERNPKSRAHIANASKVLPGGSTRTALHFDPFPLVMVGGESGHVTDLDGHTYVDLMNDLTAGLYGHSNSGIQKAITRAIESGMSLGAVNIYEIELAQEICRRFRSIDLVRFCNSGTEANLIALQLAKQLTGRSKLLAFSGGYHGGVMSYLGARRHLNVQEGEVLLADYNNQGSVEEHLSENSDSIAAIIVEPMVGSGGGILATPDFLRALRRLANESGALLIFDEVQTARLGSGGLQQVFDVTPDITTLGKFLGGGASFGALGGRREIMQSMDATREGSIGHGGTFNNNVISMAAGGYAYKNLATDSALQELNALGDYARQKIGMVARDTGVPLQTGGFGSIISIHFQAGEIRKPADITTPAITRKYVHLGLLNRGIYCARRGTINLSLENTRNHIDQFAEAFASLCDGLATTRN